MIPVYQGENSLEALVNDINDTGFEESTTPCGHKFIVSEILLILDRGPDNSGDVARKLESTINNVRSIWLSRNYGQHPATLAGMASSGGDWVVTMDEDGQHNPIDIPGMLDKAINESAVLVYAYPLNKAPHGPLRNFSSQLAKKILSLVSGNNRVSEIQSFRLILGDIARSVAAYAGSGVYLDIALGWVTDKTTTYPVKLSEGINRPSGYSRKALVSHFMRMLISSGTRGLRLVSGLGVLLAGVGLTWAIVILASSISNNSFPSGWPSLSVLILVSSGALLLSLGIIAEYLGMVVNMAMGKPPYLIVSDPAVGPLGEKKN